MVAGAVGLLGVTACEPPPPVPVLTVTAFEDGYDAAPGDGVCETSEGSGRCTLRAAVAEANALGRADLILPGGVYGGRDPMVPDPCPSAPTPIEGTGVVHVNPGAPTDVTVGAITVRPGGGLVMDRVRVHFLRVEGTLVARRTRNFDTFLETAGSVTIASTGLALITDSQLASFQVPVHNEGRLFLRRSTVSAYDSPAVSMTPTAVLEVGSSALVSTGLDGRFGVGSEAAACSSGTVHSTGRNFASASTSDPNPCRLDGPDDIIGGDPVLQDWLTPAPGSPLVDRVPIGVDGCGSELGRPDPVDGDGDGIPACDIGGVEI